MDDAGGEFRYIGQLALLSGHQGVRISGLSKSEGILVCSDCEMAALKMMTEMTDSSVNTEEIPVKGTVLQLGLL